MRDVSGGSSLLVREGTKSGALLGTDVAAGPSEGSFG